MTDALWYDIEVRKQRLGDVERDGGFTGFVRRMLRGSDMEADDRVETMMWWERNRRRCWEEGKLTG